MQSLHRFNSAYQVAAYNVQLVLHDRTPMIPVSHTLALLYISTHLCNTYGPPVCDT